MTHTHTQCRHACTVSLIPRITSYSGSSFDWTLTASLGADIPYAGFLDAKPLCCLLLILILVIGFDQKNATYMQTMQTMIVNRTMATISPTTTPTITPTIAVKNSIISRMLNTCTYIDSLMTVRV